MYHFNIVTSNICYKSLCIPSGYNKLNKPPLKNITDKFNNIKVFIDFIQILSVDKNQNTITLKLNLEIVWNEPRVTLLPNVTKEEMEHIIVNGYWLPNEITDHLWLPSTYIYNVHKIKKYKFIHHVENHWYWLTPPKIEAFDEKNVPQTSYTSINSNIYTEFGYVINF